MSELNLILLGPPGAGKGTQAERLVEDFAVAYYATGDILRKAVKEGTELGRQAETYMKAGDLVPDDVIIGVILEAVERPEAADGFLLDGFPRTIAQGEALEGSLEEHGRSLTAVLLIEAPDDEIVAPALGPPRLRRPAASTTSSSTRPSTRAAATSTAPPLVQREDDKPETIRKRLEVYHRQTAPLIAFYEERGLLRRFDGSRRPTEVHDHIRAAIATLRLEDTL